MTNILILTADDNLALGILRALGVRGLSATVAGTGNGWLKLSRHCAGYVAIARSAEELAAPADALIGSLADLVRQRGIDLIIPGDVAGQYCAARLKEVLPTVAYFPSAEPETLRLLDNKWTFYRLLTEQNLPSPRTWKVESVDEARRLPLPLVFKPFSSSGGLGVTVVRDEAEREALLSSEGGLPLPVLAQEFIDGEDVDISFLADRGRVVAWAVQTRDRAGAYHFIDDERVVGIARRIAQACAYTGLAHVDMRYDGPARAAVKVIECNPRFWGSFQHLLSFDVDFIGRGLALAAGAVAEPAAAGPIGTCAGLQWSLRRLLTGQADMSSGTRGYLSRKFLDPLPELYKGVRRVLG